MEPFTFILALGLGAVAVSALWAALENFLAVVIDTVLPATYGAELTRVVRKVTAVLRRVADAIDQVKMVAEVLEACGRVVTADWRYVSWAEVPREIREEIEWTGEYRYEQPL